jgi:hypothetical protein
MPRNIDAAWFSLSVITRFHAKLEVSIFARICRSEHQIDSWQTARTHEDFASQGLAVIHERYVRRKGLCAMHNRKQLAALLSPLTRYSCMSLVGYCIGNISPQKSLARTILPIETHIVSFFPPSTAERCHGTP